LAFAVCEVRAASAWASARSWAAATAPGSRSALSRSAGRRVPRAAEEMALASVA